VLRGLVSVRVVIGLVIAALVTGALVGSLVLRSTGGKQSRATLEGDVVTVAPGVGKAAADPRPAWKILINDWYDGQIDGVYRCSSYKAALRKLPVEGDTYSTARRDIESALQTGGCVR
jgi:hypothetical protein